MAQRPNLLLSHASALGNNPRRLHSRRKYLPATRRFQIKLILISFFQVILYLSYFYKHHELSIRLGFFWTMMSVADILSALLGAGLLHMRGVLDYSGWRWLFLLEAIITLIVGLFSFLLMPREETIIVNRVIREDPSKSDMHNRQPITPKLLWKCLKDFDLWPLYILGLTFQIPAVPEQQYLTLSLRQMKFDTLTSNLLSIPYTVIHSESTPRGKQQSVRHANHVPVAVITMLATTYAAEAFRQLTFVALVGQFWILPFLIYLNVADTSSASRWTIWAVTTLLLGYPNGMSDSCYPSIFAFV